MYFKCVNAIFQMQFLRFCIASLVYSFIVVDSNLLFQIKMYCYEAILITELHGTYIIIYFISLGTTISKTVQKNNIQFLTGYSLHVVKLINPLYDKPFWIKSIRVRLRFSETHKLYYTRPIHTKIR